MIEENDIYMAKYVRVHSHDQSPMSMIIGIKKLVTHQLIGIDWYFAARRYTISLVWS